MMTSQVLRALEGKGLIIRTAHPGDRRARVITPTPDGARLPAQANAAANALYFTALGPQAAAFLAYLHTLDHAHR